jgi:hypothetical protein
LDGTHDVLGEVFVLFEKGEGLKKRKAHCVTAGLPNIFLNETWHCNTDQELIPCHHQCLFVMIFCIARTKMKHFFRKYKFFLRGSGESAFGAVKLSWSADYADYTDFIDLICFFGFFGFFGFLKRLGEDRSEYLLSSPLII